MDSTWGSVFSLETAICKQTIIKLNLILFIRFKFWSNNKQNFMFESNLENGRNFRLRTKAQISKEIVKLFYLQLNRYFWAFI